MRKFFVTFFAIAIYIVSQIASAENFLPLPGAEEFPVAIEKAIDRAWQQRNRNEKIRSQHLREDGRPLYANRLILEIAPYLNQHAHNPVNWFGWGDEAFQVAKDLGRPVLVSIGYSSCHWCHVMEEQSYDHLGIAQLLNEHFVAIKVDRESSPDVDELYLLAVQIMGGHGGWPLHVFVNSQGQPFLGMTYLPPEEFTAVLKNVRDVWADNQAKVQELASSITDTMQTFGLQPSSEIEITKHEIDQFIAQLAEQEQQIFEFNAPVSRFPSESELFLLLDVAVRYEDNLALKLAEDRLISMAYGGVRDHVGGGFHRYAVDSQWLVPHFEKMLYNQAHLGRAYTQAYMITGKGLYRRVAEQTLDYVLRDLRSEQGVFWSATDSDSEGEEGTFFLWTRKEIVDVLGDEADFAIAHFGVTESGNFEGMNILHAADTLEGSATASGFGVAEYLLRLDNAVEKLRRHREQREHPYLDNKIITAWNAMMITTLSDASDAFGRQAYLTAAVTAANYLWKHAWDPEQQRLFRILRSGERGTHGRLRDYAYLIEAMVSLYDRSGDRQWLMRSETLASSMRMKFWDEQHGGFFSTSAEDASSLVVRNKDRFDEALPSGNSVAMRGLALLFARTGKQIYANTVDNTTQAFAAEIVQIPTSYAYALKAIDDHRLGLIGTADYAAYGKAKLAVEQIDRSLETVRTEVVIYLEEGWYVQSNAPSNQNLTATLVDIDSDRWSIANVKYPPAQSINLAFQNESLSVLEGEIRIPVAIQGKDESRSMVPIDVTFQACSHELCLLPETVRLELPLNAI